MKTMIEKLKILNFTEPEALTYLTLLKKSPLTGYAVAQETNIDKSQIYIVLEGLISKGCVVASKNKKIQYIPISFNVFLERYKIESERKRTCALEMITSLKEVEPDDIKMVNSLYRIQDIYEKLNQLIQQSNTSITLRIWNDDLYAIEKSLEEAYVRGVKLNIAVYGEYQNSVFPVYSVEYMKWSQDKINYRFIKIDFDSEIIFCACLSTIFQTYATWTSNKMLHDVIRTSINYDVALCKTYKSYPEDVRLKWAEHMMKVRKRYN